METPEIMTVNELADYLRMNKITIYRLIKANKLPFFRVGYDYRFLRTAIEIWIKDLSESK